MASSRTGRSFRHWKDV